MTRQIVVPPATRTLVFRRRFSSVPQVVSFDADPVEPGGVISGQVERVGSRWILGRTRSATPLREHNTVEKGYWDTFFHVYVTAVAPVRITIGRPRMRYRALIWTLVALVTIAAVATVAAVTLGR